ncbi:MAG: vitamin B12-dependent ribonucleotide reductase [Candidatus Omnitrophica bacterium]|nr:vitamin B12-dependent ribonucleotide reductase [Candidatus Omnitrophota bacterium]
MEISGNAERVLKKRYLKKDVDGNVVETPEEMFRRVADNIAKADTYYAKKANTEKTANEFYDIMSRLEFLPNSPTLMNAGKELQQLSACFVLPVKDSMEGIFDSLKSAALIHKSGGGTGFSFSNLRPKNSVVKSTGGVASGPVSFMKVFDAATQAVKQGGTRRGANMGILSVDHPDILEFLSCKENNKDITNFNISIFVTDDFMKKVEEGLTYDLIDPHTKKKVDQLNAREVFDKIVKMAWKNGEPGIIFGDRVNKDNPTPKLGMIESTNPCGEQPLLPYESCNLGSINLFNMVSGKGIEWDKLAHVVRMSTHFLDNVIDMNKFPLAIIREKTRENRKIGLGVMGFADMLIKLGIPYDSQEALDIADKMMKFILDTAMMASSELAEKRGEFPSYKKSVYYEKGGPRLRNATITTIAPTGTLSIIAGCSSGIEPIFAVSYIRNVMDNDELVEVHPLFLNIAKERGFYSEELMKKIAKEGGVGKCDEVPEDVKRLFRTSLDISPEYHIKMQGVFQKYTHNAVSKTINFPNTATVDDVKKSYELAYKYGCKGITIYRDKSRDEQVLNIGSVNKDGRKDKEGAEVSVLKELQDAMSLKPKPRGVVTFGTTTKASTGCGNLYITINNDELGRPFEVFMQMGKAGGCAMSQLEAIGRLVSLALRSGVEVDSIVSQLRGIRCPSPSWEKGGGRIFSCSDAIARVIERRMTESKEIEKRTGDKMKAFEFQPTTSPGNNSDQDLSEGGTTVKTAKKQKTGSVVGVCPDCGAALRHIEGCQVCNACGFSKCG